MKDDDDRIWTNAMVLAERDNEIDALEEKLARADARIAELEAALRALLDAPPDFASHVAAIENARAALVKESPDE